MAKSKGTETSAGISRRNVIQGAAATAVIVSSGVLSGCNEAKKPTKAAVATGQTDFESLRVVAVWAALTGTIGDFNPSSVSDSGVLAQQFVTRMNITKAGAQDIIKGVIDSIRSDGHMTVVQGYYATLATAMYTGTQCPLYYNTLVQMANGVCQ
jgi:hypothetical protein